MPGTLYKAAAIVGAAESDQIGFLDTPVTSLQLHIEAIRNVCAETGIPIASIDGVFSA
ncbi:MAG TPA: thiolase, partial [Gammaproteobacteria bacterium]|nr:thiolase [Gammaproteobacteria bacterium]